VLDDLTYKTIAIGFPIFTLGGLIFGAIWADQAWGKYWSWDPKGDLVPDYLVRLCILYPCTPHAWLERQ